MHYIIYKTTNLINHKYYIGKHITDNLNDTYLGSGKALIASIKKYGKHNFSREILFELASEELMNIKEKEVVNEALINDPMCYNMVIGGEGGPTFKGRQHTEETKQKIREIRIRNGSPKRTEKQKLQERERRYAKNNGKWHNQATIEKLRQAAYKHHGTSPETSHQYKRLTEEEKVEKRKLSDEKRSKSLMGHEVTQETRDKLRQSNLGQEPHNKSKICVNDGIKNKFIKLDELDYYLSIGYTQGGVKKSSVRV